MNAMLDEEEEEKEEEEGTATTQRKALLLDPWFLHTQQFIMQATHYESSVHIHHNKQHERKSIRMLLASKIRHLTGRDSK